MVAERASQGHAPAHLQVLDCFPKLSPFREQAMASDMVFTPGRDHNLHAMHNERAMLIAGLIAAAHVFWPMGRAWVEKKLRGMVGDTEVDNDEILDTVEKEFPAKIKEDNEDSESERPTIRKNLGLGRLQLTPPQQPQQQPQPQLVSVAQSSLVSSELAAQLQKRLDKEQTNDQDYHDDMAKAKLLSLQQPIPSST